MLKCTSRDSKMYSYAEKYFKTILLKILTPATILFEI